MNATTAQWLQSALGLSTEQSPFPWQRRLLESYLSGRIERTLDIPTGLGKTAAMAIWLVARASGAQVPRRLVYVVDRRAVVDQATEVAEGLRRLVDANAELKRALGLAGSLPISTLRGKYVDNRKWMEDPSAPAIIIGTVDMVGSRLLFEGYGVSRKLRPYQAGLLGSDTLVVLDEAHLVPPFEALLSAIANGSARFGPPARELAAIIPPFAVQALSATGAGNRAEIFGLEREDFADREVRRRIDAVKQLELRPLPEGRKLADVLAEGAWALRDVAQRDSRCIVFCDSREVARSTREKLLALGASPDQTELFVGERRVYERQRASERLATLGFIAGKEVERIAPAFVVATSAAEVGLDLDADHMVSDLVPWERMVQRLGRVNRRGRVEARVIVLRDLEAEEAIEARLGSEGALARPFAHLETVEGGLDASPGAILRLRHRIREREDIRTALADATTPPPLHPALDRPVVEAWSMTSLSEHTGRPDVAGWLRGWVKEEAQTRIVWRRHLAPERVDGRDQEEVISILLAAAPPHVSEQLEAPTYRVVEWLQKRAQAVIEPPRSGGEDSPETVETTSTNEGDGNGPTHRPLRERDVALVVLKDDGSVAERLALSQILPPGDSALRKRRGEELFRLVGGQTLVVDARLGGMAHGVLDENSDTIPSTADDEVAESAFPVDFRFRIERGSRELRARSQKDLDGLPWEQWLRLPWKFDASGDPSEWLLVEGRDLSSTLEDDRSAGPNQGLSEHQQWTAEAAQEIAAALSLPAEYARMLAIAGRLHDEGKRASRWQRAFRAPLGGGPYAKAAGPIDFHILDGYRHELGSLPAAVNDSELAHLPDDIQQLALHLIAAHHGFARPWIETRGCDDAPPSRIKDRAREVALRFVELQRRWGPWGLAWWEALLRAADQRASRRNLEQGRR